jgi:hypothetical protein
VGWLFEKKSLTQTQRNYRTQFNQQPPSGKQIRDWQRRFLETGIVHDCKRSGRPGVSEECVERIRESPGSTEHGKNSSIVWTFSVLPRERKSRSTEVNKKLQSFTMICRRPHMAISICLRATIFQNPEGTLWIHCRCMPVVRQAGEEWTQCDGRSSISIRTL